LQLDNADVDYTDRTLTPELTTRFGQLQGNLSGLSNIPPQQGRVSLKGKVNQVGNLDMSGSIATPGTDQQSDLVLNLENLELLRLSPYSGRYLGYGIAGGKLALKLDYRLQGTRINASNQIILNRLELGQPMLSEQAVGVPTKLGLALLRDGNNVIELNVPVNGDLADPEFHVGKVMMRAFADLLTKAATSPFALTGTLADIAGLGGEQMHQVSFAPGGTELTAISTRKLAALAQVFEPETGACSEYSRRSSARGRHRRWRTGTWRFRWQSRHGLAPVTGEYSRCKPETDLCARTRNRRQRGC